MALTVWAYNADNKTVNGNRRAEFSYSQKKGSSSENFSTISWTLTIAGSNGGSNWYDTGPIEAWIGSNRVYHLSERKSWTYGKFPCAPGSADGSFKLWHNNDGSIAAQKVVLKAAIYTGTVHEDSTTWNLGSIARYFSSAPTLNLDSKTETSLSYSWKTSETCSEYTIYYKKSSDSQWTTVSKTGVNAAKGTFTLSNLSASTLYHVYIIAKRSDSGLTSSSETQKPTTYQWPYIKSVGSNPLTIGNNQTIKIYNPKGRSITFKIDTSDGTNLYSKSWNPGTGEDIEYTITDLTASKFYDEIPSATSGTANYYCYYSSTSYKVSTVSATYQVTGAEKPVITAANFSFKDSNTNITKVTSQGVGGWLVQSLSTLQLSLVSKGTLTNNPNGYIKSYDATFAGTKKTLAATASTNSGTFEAWSPFNNSGTHKITITATDSRGLTSDPITINVTFVAYSSPTVTLSGSRLNNYGETINLSMAYSYSGVNSKNSLTKKYRRTDTSTYTTTTSTANPIPLTLTASNENAYTYEAVVTDTFGKTASSTITIPRGLPIMFVDSAVLGVGVNTFPTISGLDVNGPIRGSGNLGIEGTATIKSDITTQGAVTATGRVTGKEFKSFGMGPNNTNNTPEYKLIGSQKMAAWNNGRLTFAVSSRHTGNGIISISYGCNNASVIKDNIYCFIEYSGNHTGGSVFNQSMLVAHLKEDSDGSLTLYFFWHYTDYDSAWFTLLAKFNAFTPITNGAACLNNVDTATYGNLFAYTTFPAYPIGAIYMSTRSTSPASLFGGTWEQIKDKFLLGIGDTYKENQSGGSAAVTLKTEQIPGHSHTWSQSSCTEGGWHTHRIGGDHDAGKGTYGWSLHNNDSGAQDWCSYTTGAGSHTHTIGGSIGSTGGGQSHDNMPPYTTVYIWKRIG